MADFATLTELKAALDVVDSASDSQLTLVNRTATQLLIDFMNRDPRPDDFVHYADGLGTENLLVPEYPINQVFEVRMVYPVETLIDLSTVGWSDDLIFLRNARVPKGRRNVKIIYNAGLDPVPKSLSLAAIYTARAMLTSRKVNLNATGESWAGVSSETWNLMGPGVMPVAAQTLLQNYVRRGA